MSDAAGKVERLAVKAREAAQMLNISERRLFALTKRGEILCLRNGNRRLYRVADLNEWLAKQVAKAS